MELHLLHGGLEITSGTISGKTKPQTALGLKWNAVTNAGSGSIVGYELRYSTDNWSTSTTVSSSISGTTYSFTPNVMKGQTLKMQLRAKNSYGAYSSWSNFPDTLVYVDGNFVAKVNNTTVNVMAYGKVGGTMRQISKIYVKINGVMRQIDLF